jgi:hypothetical protein
MKRRYLDHFGPMMNDGMHVFVFGSNLTGRHGAGAAWQAHKSWGAVNGVGEGEQGQAYAIPTKDQRLEVLDLEEIKRSVLLFIKHAEGSPNKTFLVTPIGTGLAGYAHEDIAPFFRDAPSNCVLPLAWRKCCE